MEVFSIFPTLENMYLNNFRYKIIYIKIQVTKFLTQFSSWTADKIIYIIFSKRSEFYFSFV